jgi:hypothetical protein
MLADLRLHRTLDEIEPHGCDEIEHLLLPCEP